MRKRVQTMLALAIVLTTAGCAPKMKVYRITRPGAAGDAEVITSCRGGDHSGIYYALPRTVITVDATVTRRDRSEKECTTLARKFNDTKLQNLLRQLEISFDEEDQQAKAFKIDQPAVASFGEPDPSQVFVVDVGSRFLNKVSTTLDLGETGLLNQGVGDTENQGLQVGLKVIATTAAIAAKVVGVAALAAAPGGGVPTGKLARCRRFAQHLVGLEEQRLNLTVRRSQLVAEGKPTGEQDLALKGITGEIDTLRGLFEEAKEYQGPVHCEIRPQLSLTDYDLFSFSKESGIQIKNASACFVSPDLHLIPKGTQKTFSLKVSADDATSTPDISAKIRKAREKRLLVANLKTPSDCRPHGLFFRVPGVRQVSLFRDDNEVDRRSMPIAQLGEVDALPSRTGNIAGGKADLTVYTTTGAVKKLTTEAKTLDLTTLDSISTNTGSVIDAIKTAKETKASAEVTQLTREKQVLELKRDIKKLQDELGITGDQGD